MLSHGRIIALILALSLPTTGAKAAGHVAVGLDVLSGPGDKAAPRFSAIAVFAPGFTDGYPPDALSELILGNEPLDERFIRPYLESLYEWYREQLSHHPEIYGPGVSAVLEDLRAHDTLLDGVSSILVLTEYGKPHKPIATLRIALPGPKGTLPVEQIQPQTPLEFPCLPAGAIWHEAPELVPESGRGRFQLGFPFRRRWRRAPQSVNAEIKTYSFQPGEERAYFPYLYAVAHELQFFYRAGFGRAIGAFVGAAYGRNMSVYHRMVGLFPWRTLPASDKTGGNEVFVSRNSATGLHDRLQQRIQNIYPDFVRASDRWLVYNAALSARLKRAGRCRTRVEAAAKGAHSNGS